MPFDLNINLPETAKALSAPLSKLVEVVGAGCGRLYEPTGIRRRARAEGDALVIMEEARARASETSIRAAQRLIETEERRQRNIEAIAARAAQELPEEVSPDPVDPDWSTRFFFECQDISNEQMQSVWAKLLAGEVAAPGSFSPRTLWVLKNLAAVEASFFNTLCKHSFRAFSEREMHPFVGIAGEQYWSELGLEYTALQRLQDAGLIVHHPLGIQRKGVGGNVLRGPEISLLLQTDAVRTLPLGKVSLTVAGEELSHICEWAPPRARIDALAREFQRLFKVSLVKVLAEEKTGTIRYMNLDDSPV